MKRIVLALGASLLTIALPAAADKAGYAQLDFDIALERCLDEVRSEFVYDETEPSPKLDLTPSALTARCTRAMVNEVAKYDPLGASGIGIPITGEIYTAWSSAVDAVETANAEREIISLISREDFEADASAACTAQVMADPPRYAEVTEIVDCEAGKMAARWIAVTQDSLSECLTPDGYICAARTFPAQMRGFVEEADTPGHFLLKTTDSDTGTPVIAPDHPYLQHFTEQDMRFYIGPGGEAGLIIDWIPVYDPGLTWMEGVTAMDGEAPVIVLESGEQVSVLNRTPWREDELGRPIFISGMASEGDNGQRAINPSYYNILRSGQ